MASDHGVSADVDVLLVEYCGLREADDAVVAECPKTPKPQNPKTPINLQ